MSSFSESRAFAALRLPWPSGAPYWLGVLLGAAAQLQQRALWSVGAYETLMGGAVGGVWALWWVRQSAGPWGRNAGVLVLAFVMAFASTGWRATQRAAQVLTPAAESVDWWVSGEVMSLPQKGNEGWRFEFAPDPDPQPLGTPSVQGELALPAVLWLGWYSPRGGPGDGLNSSAIPVVPELKVGDRWRLALRLKRPHGLFNPGGFDGELWLWEQGYGATGTVRTGARVPAPVLLNPGASRALATVWAHPIEWMRQSVRAAIWKALPEPRSAGVVVALVTGDQQAIATSDWDLFRLTGVAHLMSISGLHITLLAWLGARLVSWAWRCSERLVLRWPAVTAGRWLGWGVALAYSAFCGWGVPAQRTVLMLGVVTVLQTGAKRWPAWLVWLFSAAVVVLWDPWALMQAGFWLSFVAVGILFLSGAGTSSAVVRPGWSAWLANQGRQMLREQGLMTLALAPLTWILFGQVSLVGLLANLVAIPWVSFVVTPLAFLGGLWTPLWQLAAWGVQGLLWLLDALASSPVTTWSVAAAPAWLNFLGLLGAVVLVLPSPWRVRLLGLAWVLPMVLWQAPRPTWGEFEILAPDVGQGNAVLLRTQSHSLLYDSGPQISTQTDAGQRVLVPLLKRFREPLDRLMLSHRDIDHTGGAAAVLAAYPQAEVWSSLEANHPLLQGRLGSVTTCQAGQSWNWDGVDFEVLHPLTQDVIPARSPLAKPVKSNALSCVLRISSASGRRALLVGDIEMPQEQDLVIRDEFALRADFLLVPHHGSNTSSSQSFLQAVSPRWSLVQSGYRNRFGHPAPRVVSRYVNSGLDMVDSPHCGAATWASDAPNRLRCEREVHRRYWNDQPAGDWLKPPPAEEDDDP